MDFMKNVRLVVFIFLSLMNIGMGELFAKNSESYLNSQIDSIFKKMKMTGLGIAVTKEDSIIYVKSFGYRDIPSADNDNIGEPLDNEDLFRIASISKTFIATVILQLVEEGKLNLDDDVQNYLKFPLRNPLFFDDPITIKMLLTHTSSINDSQKYWSLDIINPNVSKEYFECYSKTKPGVVYKYCNFNYLLLGAVIEGVTNNRFDVEIDQRIMKPLGINGGFNCNVLESEKFVKLYRYDKDKGTFKEDDEAYRPYKYQIQDHYVLGESLGLAYPPSGMKITTSNLAKYMMMHMHGGILNGVRILSEDSEKRMRDNYVGKHNYGFSFRQYRNLIHDTILYGQTGGGFGLKSAMIFDPTHKMGFVIISSGSASEYIDGYGDIHKPLIQLLYSFFK